MTEQKKNEDNTGFFMANEGRTTDSQPHFTGTANVEGVEKRMAIWKSVSKKGKEYYKVIYSPLLPPNTNPSKKEGQVTGNKPTNQTNTEEQNHHSATAAPISDEFDDLDAILRSTDEEDPFN